MQSVLNVRMDAALKERGDKVLSDNGISVSDAVRALWTELAKTHTIPDFIQRTDEVQARKNARKEALDRLSRIGANSPRSASKKACDLLSLSDKDLRDARYAQMWDEYEALS